MQKKEIYIQQETEYIDILNCINFFMGKKRIINILISGPPGIGKTFLCEKLAEELKCPYRDITGHPGLTREDLEGIPNLEDGTSGWINGFIPQVIELANREKLVVAAFHEYNEIQTNVQPSMNSYFDHQGKFNLTTYANKEFKVNVGCTVVNIATINENISGINEIQQSAKDRYRMKIFLKYPKLSTEIKVLTMKTDITKEYAEILCRFSNELRQAASQGKVSKPISTRELIAFTEMLQVPGVSQKKAVEYCITNKLAEDDDELKLVNDLIKTFGLMSQIKDIKFNTDNNINIKTEQKTQNIKINDIFEPDKDYGTYEIKKENLKFINFKGTIYEVIEKGAWCPMDKWVAKIVTKNNYLELHKRNTDGNKEVIRTDIKFNFI